MRNKWFAILFSAIFILMMIGAPTTLLLTKAGVLPKENVGNKITPEKTYEEGDFLYGPLTAIEDAKVAIKDTYINYLPGFLNITNTFKPLKNKINRPVIDWLAEKGRDDIIRVPQSCSHIYDDTVFPPSCTEDGYTLHVCRLCKESEKISPVPATGHTYSSEGTQIEVGCESYGYISKVCDTCNSVEMTDMQDPLGHNYVLASSIGATPTADGEEIYTCSRCEHSHRIVLKYSTETDSSHTHRDTVLVIQPTCDTAGYTLYGCDDCNSHRYESYTEPLGHMNMTEIIPPSCQSEGYTRRFCKNCEKEEIFDRVAAIGHSYKVTTVPATVYEEGYDLHDCINCTYSMKTNYTPKVILGLPAPTTVTDPEGTKYSATLLSKREGSGFRTYRTTATYPDGTKDTTLVRIIAMDRDKLYNKMLETSDLIDAMVSKSKDVNWYFAFTGNMETTMLAKKFFPEEDASYIYEDFLARLPSSVQTMDIEINSFRDYASKYYITDHHWNHKGVMEAYYRIMAMLRKNYADAEPMTLDRLYYYPDVKFYGSLARGTTDYSVADPFGVYFFNLPRHSLTIDTSITYGATITLPESLAIYESGKYTTTRGYNHYTEFYRVPSLIEYPDNKTGRRLLFIGDSYSLPLIELVAANFDVTYVRYEDRSFNADPTDLYYDEFIKQNGITDVIVLEEFVKVIQGYGNSWPSGFINIYPDRAWKARKGN